jgi:4-amino-4-deoxy-L-arabinose transferase-like glycosyltransferase
MKYSALSKDARASLGLLCAVLLLAWCIGIFGRGYWTPDEPREADIAWRMSWQAHKAVPLLAGEAFCEKPPLTYWMAAVPIRLFGAEAWSARLPNLLYALITALGVGLLARRSSGAVAGMVGAAAVSTLLLAYQTTIWLATDAPLLAAVSIALVGAYRGFYATERRERLAGYLVMHAALGAGFLCKSGVAWMVPALTLLTLAIWERRWRELLRFELYVGLLLQAAMIGTWIWFVYTGPDGVAHLKVFFWNNLVGRFTRVDAPGELQYTTGHRNSPGKYLIELPVYLAPWTLLVIAAIRRAWRKRNEPSADRRTVRFAVAASLPPLVLLSFAATARNVYFAPALPGVALLLAWWASDRLRSVDPWDERALRATSVLLLLGVALFAAALGIAGSDAWASIRWHAAFVIISAGGLILAAWFAARAWPLARDATHRAEWALFLAYCTLLVAPASQLYARVDAWEDLGSIARAVERDAAGQPLILLAPDETTRAMIDLYARTDAVLIPGPPDEGAYDRLRAYVAAAPPGLVLVKVPGRESVFRRSAGQEPSWKPPTGFRTVQQYALPHGRRYALLEASTSR